MFRRSVIFMLLVLSYGILNPVHAERMYGSGVGRFLTPDPALNTVDPGTLMRISMRTENGRMLSTSPYAYGFNNPLRYVDPDGRWSTEIHNKILTSAFKGLLSSHQIEILKAASVNADRNQSRESAFKHAMRSPFQSAEEAEQLMNLFLNEKVNEFIAKDGDDALSAIGVALHAIMDTTAPAHEGFQIWLGLDTPLGLLAGLLHRIRDGSISDKKLEETEALVRQFYAEAVRKKKEAEESR